MRILAHCSAFFLCASLHALADPGYPGYPGDDAHNHDGSHPESVKNCGTNYMLPGETARLGSHSFMILGKSGETHIYAEHRSGTPPHNYQFVFRVRLDPPEMKAYEDLLPGAKTLPAFTTIWFDEQGQQLARTFWCLQDLDKIFGGARKSGDEFEKLFPIHASLQRDPDHEGAFEIEKSVVRGKFLTLERGDIELLYRRYIPAYLPQEALRKAIRKKGVAVTKLFTHNPLSFDEPEATASMRKGFMDIPGAAGNGKNVCPANYYGNGSLMPESVHTFLVLGESGKDTILATHFYDQAPQNFQTVLRLKLAPAQAEAYQRLKQSGGHMVFRTDGQAFCMDDARKLAEQKKLRIAATFYRNTALEQGRLGTKAGELIFEPASVEVLVNRRLESLMNLGAVAKSVKTEKKKPSAPPKPPKDY